MKTYSIIDNEGNTILCCTTREGSTWYVIEDSSADDLIVNCTHSPVTDGVNIYELEDFDCFTANSVIDSEDELLKWVEM